MRHIVRIWTSLCCLPLVLATAARAQAPYTWKDADGTQHWSDLPPTQEDLARTKPDPDKSAPAVKPKAEPVSKRIELPYIPNEGSARRVIVSVRFNDRVTARMALDTGAPGMVISSELAERLDLLSKDEGKLLIVSGGIGGNVPAIRTILDTVAVGGATERFVPVTITSRVSPAFEGLVGMDFMGQYTMTIDPKRQVVVLQEQPSEEGTPGGHVESWWRANFAEFREQRDSWRDFGERLDRAIADPQLADGVPHEELVGWRSLATLQVQEAEKLVARLERYASTQGVPRHWR